MKVIQFIDTLRSGGKERQLVELLKGLAKAEGVDCELVIMSKDIHYSYLNDLDIKVHYLLRKSKKDCSILYRFYQLCKKIRPNIVHSWSSMCSVYALPAVKLLGVSFVNGFLRNAPPNLSFPDKEWIRAKLSFPFSDRIVANSLAGLHAYRVPTVKAIHIHNGFDLERLANLATKAEVRDRYSLDTEKVVGMVASFSDNKDYHTYIDAAQRILEKRDNVTFVAIGDGKNMKKCQKMVSPRFQERIKLLGKQREVESISNVFSVGVLASNAVVHGEGISNSIMEYMALGKPVVATDCGGNRELVIDGNNGFIIKHGDVDDLTDKLITLLDDSALAKQFGCQGRQRIANEFSLEKMTRGYIELYRGLMP